MILCLTCKRPMFACFRDPCPARIAMDEASARFWPGPKVLTNAEYAEVQRKLKVAQ